MTLRSFVFGSGNTSRATDLGLLVLRLGFGLALAFAHGLGKLPPSEGFVQATAGLGFPLPVLFAWAAALSEFLGGLLIAIGLATRPAAIFISITMTVAAFVQHGADPFAEKELALLYLVSALTLVLTGAGRFSLDHFLVRRSPPRY